MLSAVKNKMKVAFDSGKDVGYLYFEVIDGDEIAEDFSKKEPKSYEIRFKNNNGGKPVEVYIPVENK